MLTDFLHQLHSWRPSDTWITVTAMMAAMSCALPGVWLMLRQHSMMGDALSHTALPAIVGSLLGFHALEAAGWLKAGSARTLEPLFLLFGAAATGVFTALATESLQKIAGVDPGTALGVVFTSLFALGLLLMRLFADNIHIDPDCVLFGLLETEVLNPAFKGSRLPVAVLVNGAAFLICLVLMLLFYKELKLSAFDPELANALGIRSSFIHYGLMVATALTVTAAFKTVGTVLAIGLLIAPAAAASLWTDRLKVLIVLSLFFAAATAALGHLAAKTLPAVIFPRIGFPTVNSVATSGMMSATAGGLFLASLLFAPSRGLFSQMIHRYLLEQRIVAEDLLGLFYRLEEAGRPGIPVEALETEGGRWGLKRPEARKAVKRLRRSGSVEVRAGQFRLTSTGRKQAVELIASHRLWESYMRKYFDLPPDHLHAPAHRVEHYLDPALRRSLMEDLESPAQDPHGKAIPQGEGL